MAGETTGLEYHIFGAEDAAGKKWSARDITPSFIVVSVASVTGLVSLAPYGTTAFVRAFIVWRQRIPFAAEFAKHVPGAYIGEDAVAAMHQLATTTPRVPDWKPSRRTLNAALALQTSHWQIVGATVEQFAQYASKNEHMRNEIRRT